MKSSIFSHPLLEASPTLHINELATERINNAQPVYHFGFGESRFNVHPLLQQSLNQNNHRKSYLPSKGLPALCQKVAEYYTHELQTNISAEQVIIGPGSKALIFAIQMALNADLFLPQPSWVSYQPQANLLGRKTFYVPSLSQNNFELDLQLLDETVKLSSNPYKLLVINSPNNPTGEMLSPDFSKQLANYCHQQNILILSDEIYSKVCHPPHQHTSISTYYPEGTFVLSGLSKHLSLGGWRLGIAILPNTKFGSQLMSQLVVIASEIWSAVTAPIQHAAIVAYSRHSEIENYIDTCSHIHALRTNYMRDKLRTLGIQCSRVQGAFYILATFNCFKTQLKQLQIETSIQLAEYLLKNHAITSLPGVCFGLDETELSLRLSMSYIDMEQENDSYRLLDVFSNIAKNSTSNKDEFMQQQHHPNLHLALNEFAKFITLIR